MTAPARFTQADVTRAIKGATAAGLRVGSVEIDINGKIVVLIDSGTAPNKPNPWDSELP